LGYLGTGSTLNMAGGSPLEAAKYSAVETLRDGRPMEIRALRPDDQAELLAAVERSSPKSRYRRFFGAKRYFSDKEIAYFVNVDFVNHVALVAVVAEGERPTIVGGGRYVVVHPGQAEVAFVVVDQYQGQSIGAALLRHLIAIARHAGLTELIADVLADNGAMLKVFDKCGLRVNTRREAGIVRVSLQLA
jgi:RimJ/RimL family protein N-acetyltransferase